MDFLREKAVEADRSGIKVEPIEVTGRHFGEKPSGENVEGDKAYKERVAKELEEKMKEVDRIAKAKKAHQEIKGILDNLDKAA